MPNLTLHVEADTLKDLLQKTVDALSAMNLTLNLGGAPTEAVAAPEAEAPKATRKPRENKAEEPAAPPVVDAGPSETAAESETVTEPATTSEPEAEVDPPAGDKVFGYDTDIKPAVLKLSQKVGREGVIKLLGQYSVKNAQELKPELYPAFMGTVAQMMQEAA